MTASFTCNQHQPSNDDIVRACVCVCSRVCCHVNNSGSQSLSITAVCSGGDTPPDFNITSAEWHLTQVCGCVFVLAYEQPYAHFCACVLFYALSSFHFRLSPALKVTARVCVCVCLCVCVLATYCNSLILNAAYLFLQSPSSLFPVFLYVSAISRVENSEQQIWKIFFNHYYHTSHTAATLFLPACHLLSFQLAAVCLILEWHACKYARDNCPHMPKSFFTCSISRFNDLAFLMQIWNYSGFGKYSDYS